MLAWIASLVLSLTAHAGVDLGSDFFLAGSLGQGGGGVHLRTRNTLVFQVGSIGLGVVARIEPQHPYLLDQAYGAVARFGRDFHLELEAAIVRRQFENVYGTGFLAGVFLGWQFSKNFRIGIPFTAKNTSVGTDKRWTVDTLPYLGLRVSL